MSQQPGSVRFGSAAGRWVMAAAALGSGIVFLDSTVVNVALPQIGRELPTTFLGVLEGQSYIYYGYLLTLSALLILAGALADYYGRRKLFVIGLVGFGVTSVMCGLATSVEMLVVFRVLQGAAGAILVPGSLAVITASFSGEDQGRAFGLWAGASGATTILGPVIGGALIANVSWRAAFFINVPLLLIAAYATLRHMPESRDEESAGAFDWFGALAVAVAVGGLTFGTIRGEAQEWRDPVAFIALAAGAVATIALPFLMRRRTNPLIPLELFKSRNFTVTNISTLVIYGALYVTFQYLAIFAIGTIGYNELAFGISGIPGTLFLIFLSSRFGKLAVRFGPRIFMTVGPAIMAAGLLWFARMPSDTEPWRAELSDPATFIPTQGYLIDMLPALLLFGFGLAIMVAPLTTALMRSIPVHHSGVGSAINNAISRVGPQLMGALLFIAISSSFYASLADAVPRSGELTVQEKQEVSPLNKPTEDAPPELAAAAPEASTDAFHLAMLASAGLLILGAGVNAIGIRNQDAQTEPSESPLPEASLA